MPGHPDFLVVAVFTLMHFFTEPGAFPLGKWEFVWRFLAGPINVAF